ncbi:hypothetical protein L2E82_48360 [Cichorium intybus]|uniref:Uncharacterized protein n=1 Tax=Cichorium intybus TaxID=13427 RepID=A0ACB8YX84_CICIN|nr:hypothetical protein L2E82_48360 [Cichorium intybus]
MPRFLTNLATKLISPKPNSLKFTSPIHSIARKESERGPTNGPSGFFNNPNQQNRPGGGYFDGLSRRLSGSDRTTRPPIEPSRFDRDSRPFTRDMNFVRGIMRDNPSSNLEQNADIVHIKIMRNNTFVTVTDSKGNKKMGASAGCLAEMKGGPKVSKYAAEATAEHVGRVAKSMGLKSVVVKVNGFTFFKRKKLAILGFRDGYTHSRSDRNPIVYIEDTTRKPHNGCRLRKQRRV